MVLKMYLEHGQSKRTEEKQKDAAGSEFSSRATVKTELITTKVTMTLLQWRLTVSDKLNAVQIS